jgi:hypothetical protein
VLTVLDVLDVIRVLDVLLGFLRAVRGHETVKIMQDFHPDVVGYRLATLD